MIGHKARQNSNSFHQKSQLYVDFEQGILESSSKGSYIFEKGYHKDSVSLLELDNFGVFMKSQGVRPVIRQKDDINILTVEWSDMFVPVQRVSVIDYPQTDKP